jgi:NADH dehydrogenase [ubiquinone] 1 alpha subcomplex assembly factor 1
VRSGTSLSVSRFHRLAVACICVLGMHAVDAAELGKVLFDFSDPAAMKGWQIEDDGVMGGVSKGTFSRDPDGYAIFSGEVSLENDGGFSSVQCYFDPIDVSSYRTAVIRVKGDGKNYRFIVESEKDARHNYVAEFTTNAEWQEITIPLRKMYPVRRGDRLDLPDYPAETMAQVRLMIANGKAESFRLQIASIRLE